MTKRALLALGSKATLVVAWIVPLAGCEEDAPDVPHAVYSLDDNSCQSCHANPSSGAPQSPHTGESHCVGCHSVTNNQVGTQDAGADSGGPPKIPHSTTSKDDTYCLGCHKDGVNGAKKTTHPERTNCTGCHAQ
ncbi:MAG: hypothetical protein HY898_03025 [Deltaproteobacteria bacterium]|nr:hypothetical protein [Deltaproteobacteria bacterium]